MRKLLSLMLSAALLGAMCLPAAADADGPSDWAAGEVERAVALGFVPGDLQGGWQEPVTRAEFARMALFFLAVQYNYPTSYEGFNYAEGKPADTVWSIDSFIDDYCVYQTDRDGKPFAWADYVADYDPELDYGDGNWHMQFYGTRRWFSDVSDPYDQLYVNAAYAFGLVNGKGDGRFDPEGPITRQEAAAMLARVYGNYGGAVDAPAAPFADDARIADWARADVYRATAGLGAMEGTGRGFDPLGTYTREQCAVTFLRMYENAPVSQARGNVPRLIPFDDEVQRFYDMGDFYLFRRFDTPDCTALYANHGGHMHAYSALHVIYRGGGSRTAELTALACGLSADQTKFYYVGYPESGRNYEAKALDLATLQSAPPPGREEVAGLLKGQEGFTLEAELSAGDCTVLYGATPKGEYVPSGGPELWALHGDGAVIRYWDGLPGVNGDGWMAAPGWVPPLRGLSLSGDGRTLTFEAAYGGGSVWYAYSADTATGAVTQIK